MNPIRKFYHHIISALILLKYKNFTIARQHSFEYYRKHVLRFKSIIILETVTTKYFPSHRLVFKLEKVIQSCNTVEQLHTAQRMLDNWKRDAIHVAFNPDDEVNISYLRNLIINKNQLI